MKILEKEDVKDKIQRGSIDKVIMEIKLCTISFNELGKKDLNQINNTHKKRIIGDERSK